LPRNQLTRTALLTGAGGALVTVTAGPAVARAFAVDPSGEDLALLQLAASAELVAEDFYRRAALARWAAESERRSFRRARSADGAHYRALARLIGPGAPVRQDFEFRFARGTFASRGRAAAIGASIEGTVLGVYLNAAATAENPTLRALAARAAAAEARHVAALAVLARSDPLGPALPRALDLETATTRLSPFWR
jgi:rubrerythrin